MARKADLTRDRACGLFAAAQPRCGEPPIREGFYKVDYAAEAEGEIGIGFALLALDTGMVVGADITGGRYDGSYEWNERTQLLDVNIAAWIPEGVRVVQGQTAGPGGLSFDVRCSFPREPDNQVFQATTSFGPVAVRITLLRAFD